MRHGITVRVIQTLLQEVLIIFSRNMYLNLFLSLE